MKPKPSLKIKTTRKIPINLSPSQIRGKTSQKGTRPNKISSRRRTQKSRQWPHKKAKNQVENNKRRARTLKDRLCRSSSHSHSWSMAKKLPCSSSWTPIFSRTWVLSRASRRTSLRRKCPTRKSSQRSKTK